MTNTIAPLTRPRLEALLDGMARVRLLVVGDLMLDRYLVGEADRISPEAPVPVVQVSDEWTVPGGAANVAANGVTLGATVHLLGTIGDDQAGRTLQEALESLGIRTTGLLTIPGRPTTTKTRLVARGQQVVRIDREVTTPLGAEDRQRLLASAEAMLDAVDGLILEDYDKGALDQESISSLIASARTRQLPVIVDPKIRNVFHTAGATLLKPNRRELETALPHLDPTDPADLLEARRRLGVDYLLVTLGAEGMALASSEAVWKTPSIARDVFDVSGAGDTVTAWAAAALAARATAPEAAWIANLAASVEVGKRGTATVSQAEVLQRSTGLSTGIGR